MSKFFQDLSARCGVNFSALDQAIWRLQFMGISGAIRRLPGQGYGSSSFAAWSVLKLFESGACPDPFVPLAETWTSSLWRNELLHLGTVGHLGSLRTKHRRRIGRLPSLRPSQ
jgi:hypothetical protein